MNFTEEEKKALYRKLENPGNEVKCPRCGKNLEYKEYLTAEQVKCQTERCIELNLRGI